MKIEKKFEVKVNELFFIDGNKVDLSCASVIDANACAEDMLGSLAEFVIVKTPWSLVGLDEESYNEEFLANFRDWLKLIEEKNIYAVIAPVADVPVDSSAKKEALTASFKHCARRIKDCKTVIGFSVPQEAESGFFMEELSAKHSHYVFFSSSQDVLKDGAVARLAL